MSTQRPHARRRFWPKIPWRQLSWQRLRPHSRRSAGVLAIVLLSLLWMTRGGEVAAEAPCWSRRQILDAIRFVESSNRESPPDGDGGRAIGPYQIHEVYWLDAVAFDSSLGGTYQDCRQRPYAERVIAAYMSRYAKDAWARGYAEHVARVHNGGPRGHLKRATERYWQRVRDRLPERP